MDSNKVSTANENVNSLFKSSASIVDTVCDENNWSGSASESFNTQMTDFIGTYNNVITQQLELYEDAVKDFNKYRIKRLELVVVQDQIATAKAADEDADTSALEAQAAALEAEINQLRATITATLATIESVNIDEADATTNIKEGLDELIEALASFNPEDLSTNGANGYISNLLNIPYYMQTDSRWANYMAMSGRSFWSYGCGYTSLAMILCGIKQDQNISPLEVSNYLKAQCDSDGDGRADSYVDVKGDGVADIYDALSQKSDGDGLNMGAITTPEFMEHYGVNVEQVFISNLQEAMDQGKPCIVGTASHYVVLTPGNNTYTDANGETHRTTVVYDPNYSDDTKEYEGAPDYLKNAGRFTLAYSISNAE